MKNKIFKVKNIMDGNNSRLDIVEKDLVNLKIKQQKLFKMKYEIKF